MTPEIPGTDPLLFRGADAVGILYPRDQATGKSAGPSGNRTRPGLSERRHPRQKNSAAGVVTGAPDRVGHAPAMPAAYLLSS